LAARTQEDVMDQRANPETAISEDRAEQAQRLEALIARIDGSNRLGERFKQQVRAHPVWFAAAAVGLVTVVGSLVASLIHARRQQPLARLSRAGAGVLQGLRTLDHVASTLDHLVQREPTPVGQISAAAASTLAATLARRLGERLLQRMA
jgi:hypothetical protein